MTAPLAKRSCPSSKENSKICPRPVRPGANRSSQRSPAFGGGTNPYRKHGAWPFLEQKIAPAAWRMESLAAGAVFWFYQAHFRKKPAGEPFPAGDLDGGRAAYPASQVPSLSGSGRSLSTLIIHDSFSICLDYMRISAKCQSFFGRLRVHRHRWIQSFLSLPLLTLCSSLL